MIFGLSVFAEPTFADLNGKVDVDGGWLDVIKDPCEEEPWVKLGINCAEPIKIEKPKSDWTVIK